MNLTGRAVTLYMVFITAQGLLLRQQWITGDIQQGETGNVPMRAIRADCHDAPKLLTAQGQPLTYNNANDFTCIVVLPAEHEDCTPTDETFTTNMLMILTTQIMECYSNKQCTNVTWGPQDLRYNCPDASKTAQLATNMKLQFQTFCDAPDDLTLTPIENHSVISKPRQTCARPISQSVTHSFLMNECPKSLDVREDNSELVRLTNDLNNCLDDCLGVDISGYDFGEIKCPLGIKGYTAVGLYWGCGAITPVEPAAPEPSIPQQEGLRPEPTGQQPYALVVHRNESTVNEEASALGGADDSKYLKALIVVSVLLALAILSLIGVVIYFLSKRVRRRRKYRADRERKSLPSKQALYNRMSSKSSTPSCAQSTTRYVPSADGAKITDYSEPAEEDNYEEADDLYEMMDVAKPNNNKQYPSELDKAQETNEYATPAHITQSRTDSVKYSDGYLLPTISK